MDDQQLIQRLSARWKTLQDQRQPWLTRWEAVSQGLLPTAGLYQAQDTSTTLDRLPAIVDNTGTQALYTLMSGMMSGMTSPARPWFKLATREAAYMEDPAVQQWLFEVEALLRDIFQKSNTYRVLPGLYQEMAAFGTAVSVIEDDFHTVIRHHPLTAGQYALGANAQGVVDTLYRSFQMTCGQGVKQFGLDKVSHGVRHAFERGRIDQPVTVYHAIEPNEAYHAKASTATETVVHRPPTRHQPAFRSVYWEAGQPTPLRVSSYAQFPALTPRWETLGGAVYGTAPGLLALGDIQHLQTLQKAKLKGIDFVTSPALSVPASLKAQFAASGKVQAGQLVFRHPEEMHYPIQPLFQVKPDLNHLAQEIQQVQERIRRSFYADIFLMMESIHRGPHMTAAEVSARQQEKMMVMGPVLERLHDELLRPLVETTFQRAATVGILPPIPAQLQGHPLHVEFVSVMAQAQRAGGITANDRLLVGLSQVAQISPDVVDAFDADALLADYADRLDVKPALLRAPAQVEQLRQARAQRQAQQQQLNALQQQAQTAQTLANTPTEAPSALSSLMQPDEA